MPLFSYYLRTAIHNLRRGGQRELVAILCIAFGVMSVVSMTLLSEALAHMLVLQPEHRIGAEITLDRVSEDVILSDHVAGLDALQQAGKIDRYTLIAYTSSLVYRLPGSSEMHFPAAGMGVDPSVYPLMGSFPILGAGGEAARAPDLLRGPGDVLIARDLADEEGLDVGDTILLSDTSVGAVVEGHIRGIVTDTPNHQGSKIYYTAGTARILNGGAPAENTALATAAEPEPAVAELEARGWRAYTADHLARVDEQVHNFFDISFKGSGILGMLVGGIGIANTMQVLLRRRRREVAILKTIGYQQGQLQLMFAMEAALLGILGTLLGAGLGVAVSAGLVGLFSRITNLLISWVFSPVPVLLGILIGLVTAVSFAMFAIVINSRVRPLAVLRSEALDATKIPRSQTAVLALLCGLPFAAVSALAMGSLLKGAGVLVVALLGLAVLGAGLAGSLRLITSLLPLRIWPLVHMARNNLRRRGTSMVFAMVALFAGITALAMGVVISSSAWRELDERMVKFDGDNITVIALVEQEAQIEQAFAGRPEVQHLARGYQTAVRSIHQLGSPEDWVSPLLIGRETPDGYDLGGEPWGSVPDGVYTYGPLGIPAGSQVEITLDDGSTHVLPVAGTYGFDVRASGPLAGMGLLMPNALVQRLAEPETVQFFVKAPAGEVKQFSAELGTALPQATVINLVAYAARFTQTYANLFIFAAAMAGLALLAGALLVANSVSLAMLDRRYEIGVLKAMGYARQHVLFTLVVEYGLVAVIATAAGLLVVWVFLWLVGLVNQLAGSLLVLTLGAAAGILGIGVGLTLLTVLGVTWRPTQVSPLVVLNDRE